MEKNRPEDGGHNPVGLKPPGGGGGQGGDAPASSSSDDVGNNTALFMSHQRRLDEQDEKLEKIINVVGDLLQQQCRRVLGLQLEDVDQTQGSPACCTPAGEKGGGGGPPPRPHDHVNSAPAAPTAAAAAPREQFPAASGGVGKGASPHQQGSVGGGTSGMNAEEVDPRVDHHPGTGGQPGGGESTHARPDIDDGWRHQVEKVSRFEPQMIMRLPILKSDREWPEFRGKVLVYAQLHGFDDVLHESNDLHIDVGAKDASREVLIRRHGVSASVYWRHLKAWIFFTEAFERRIDQLRMKRFTSPSCFWSETRKWYNASTEWQRHSLRTKLSEFRMPSGGNPVEAFLDLENTRDELALGGDELSDEYLCRQFVSGLPAEYFGVVTYLTCQRVSDRDEILRVLRVSYDLQQSNNTCS